MRIHHRDYLFRQMGEQGFVGGSSDVTFQANQDRLIKIEEILSEENQTNE